MIFFWETMRLIIVWSFRDWLFTFPRAECPIVQDNLIYNWDNTLLRSLLFVPCILRFATPTVANTKYSGPFLLWDLLFLLTLGSSPTILSSVFICIGQGSAEDLWRELHWSPKLFLHEVLSSRISSAKSSPLTFLCSQLFPLMEITFAAAYAASRKLKSVS